MKKVFYILAILAAVACSEESEFSELKENPEYSELKENLIICNEGLWQSDNGQLSFYDGATGVLTNGWFRAVNGTKLGDTPNDIIQVNDTLIAIAVNWSNIIQYIHPDGTACGATENVPNNRRLCSDGEYLYVTSYAHRCGSQTFEKGYVVKIDLRTKLVVGACEVGWEPEGVCFYKGKLYVVNSGGYAYTEKHEYETTVNVVDAATMRPIKVIDTKRNNLYGEVSQAGRWLCINSCGDYYGTAARTIILDCETDTLFHEFDFPSNCNATDGTLFYSVGTEFSYLSGGNTTHIHTINPATGEVTDYIYNNEVTERLRELQSPYALHVSPYTGNIYFTDAKSYATAGYLYGYTKDGGEIFAPQKLYINPGHILSLK